MTTTATTSTTSRVADVARTFGRTGELRRRDGWTRERLEAHQADALRGLLRHAVERSPFYRERLAGLDLDGPIDLAALPTLDKATLMERFDDVVTDRRLRRDELERHVAALAGDELHLDRYRVMTTSGTTGLQGLFACDRDDWSTLLALGLRVSAVTGAPTLRLGRRVRAAGIGAARPQHMSYRIYASLPSGLLRTLRLDAMRPIAERHELTMLQLACQWNLAHEPVRCVVPTLIEEPARAKPIEAKRNELAGVPAEVVLGDEDVAEIRRIGDNTGCMALKGASPQFEGEPRADAWPLDDELRAVAERWRIDPARQLTRVG